MSQPGVTGVRRLLRLAIAMTRECPSRRVGRPVRNDMGDRLAILIDVIDDDFVRDSAEPFLSRASRYAAYFTGVGVGVDVFASTESELEQMGRDGNRFAERALAEGMVLTAMPA